MHSNARAAPSETVTHPAKPRRLTFPSVRHSFGSMFTGLFAPSHLQYAQLADPSVEPSLVEMTEAAIRVLSKGDKGYYLFVEGGNIDMAHHFNYAQMALNETVVFSNAVQRALQMTSRTDTLVVVTSDHAHSMTLNGYPHRGSNVLGHPKVADGDKMPYSTLSYANGPSAPMPDNSTAAKRRNLTADNPCKCPRAMDEFKENPIRLRLGVT